MAPLANSKVDPELSQAVDRIEAESCTITEAAARLGISYNQLRRRVAAGEVPTFTVAGQARVWVVDL